MKDKREFFIVAAIFIFFFITLWYLTVTGTSQRVYLQEQVIEVLPELTDAYALWSGRGVKGRIVFLFDRYLNADPYETELSNSNYVYLSIHKNIIRSVYHIIPDALWEDVAYKLHNSPFFYFSKGTFRTTVEGTPIRIMRLSDVTRLKEKVLVLINTDYYSGESLIRIGSLLKGNILTSDLVSFVGDMPDDLLGEFERYYE